jgi:sigma-B regulation protein RsbU (phosphoserine phosphatase)
MEPATALSDELEQGMSSSSVRRAIENEVAWSWKDWMGITSEQSPQAVPGSASAEPTPGFQPPGFQPEEALALYREVFDALQVPRRLSGARRLRRGPFEIASEIFPAQFFSGDFVSVFDSCDETFLAVGDIAGKGLTAAMWSTHILGLIRTYSTSLAEPHLVLHAMNRDLYALGSVPFTTMVLATLDWRSGKLTYSNAGHCAPILHHHNGSVQQLSEGGPVLGAVYDSEFAPAQVSFGPGDMLVTYSDGVTECENANGEEFGVERLARQVRSAATLSASQSLFSIVGAVQDFAAGTPRHDDLSLMVVGSH